MRVQCSWLCAIVFSKHLNRGKLLSGLAANNYALVAYAHCCLSFCEAKNKQQQAHCEDHEPHRPSAFFRLRFFKCTRRTDKDAGVTPWILAAWPRVSGANSLSFSFASLERPGKLE